jgi:hypothetical protein
MRIALIVFGISAVVLWMAGGMVLVGFAVLAAAITYVRARSMDVFLSDDDAERELPAPRLPFVSKEPLAMSDELADLLRSATEIAGRTLEERGRFDPFVIYEDAGGTLRMRQVAERDARLALTKAREQARAVHPDVPRVVLAVMGEAEIDGRRERAVVYEAAEHHFDRTPRFAQRYEPRRPMLPGSLKGRPIYVGRSDYRLRLP